MIFELDNVELSFGEKQVLYGVYIKAEKGKITGILGSNGSGKTSLLRIFFGNLQCNNKLVRIDGKSTLKNLYSVKNIILLPQDNFLPGEMKLFKLFNIYKVSWENFITSFTNFRKYYKTRFSQLSGGERRIIAIWLSIKSASDFIMLDEPFTHLTPLARNIIKEELIKEKENKAILLTDHLYKELMEITDVMYFIKNGCSRQIENPEELEELGYLKL